MDEFATISPKILYFGTPVALVSSLNEDGSANLAPLSSFWVLGWTVTLGVLHKTKTMENLRRRDDCVINIPSPDLWESVEKLAPLTGQNPAPEAKAAQFRFEPDKFGAAGFTSLPSETVAALRVKECPAHLEGRVRNIDVLAGEEKLANLGGAAAVEVEVTRVHVRKDFVLRDHYVDPAKWQPLLYNFRHYFGLGDELGHTFRAEA